MKHKAINGWTSERMKQAIRSGNDGKRAMDDAGNCSYLDERGNKCAVGCFIPEGHAGQLLLGGAEPLLRSFPDLEGFMPLELAGLKCMQGIHDGCWPGDSDVRDLLDAWIDGNVSEASDLAE